MDARLTDEWRAIQQRLAELERQYAAAMLAYCRGEGPTPDDALRATLLAMRQEANEKLSLALAEIDRKLAESDRKLPNP